MPRMKPSTPETGVTGHRDEHGDGAGDVGDGKDDAGDEECAGDVRRAFVDLIAHEGAGLAAGEGKEDGGPEDGVAKREMRREGGCGEVRGRAVMPG